MAAALLAAATALPGLPGCAGLSADEENRLQLYRENSQGYMDRGEYLAALQQAGKALEIDPDLVSMRLIKGFCLVKLGKTHGNAAMIDEAMSVFRELASSGDGSADFRVDLGLGTAGLARALAHDAEIERIGKRLASDFITDQGRQQEQARLQAEQDARRQCLRQAESSLRDVLDDPLQKDNTYALVDLVLVLNSLGGHEDEALSLAERTLVLLDQDSHIKDLQLTARLPATARVDLQQRIDDNGEKELALRDLVATNHYRRGDVPGFLEQMRILEEHQLLGEVQYWNLAAVHEELGLFTEAIGDLEGFLKLRARRMSYEQDDKAPEVFRRLDELRAAASQQASR